MTTLLKIFQFLGLSEKALRVYELMIKRGPITASLLSQELNMPRATVYFELDALQMLNLISAVGSHKKRKFVIANPSCITELIKIKAEKINNLLPVAEETAKKINEQILGAKWGIPDIKFFRGIDGIKKVLDATIQAHCKEVLGIMPTYDLYITVGEQYLQELVKKRIKNKVRVKNIWPMGQEIPKILQNHEKQLRTIKFSQQQMHFRSGIITYDDIVVFITSTEKLFSVQIKSHDLAQTIKTLFDLVWKNAKDKPV